MRRGVSSSGQMIRRIVRAVEYGYFFYVTGWIPEGKEPERTEEKLIRQYEIRGSRTELYRDKLAGRAKVRLYRFGRFFVLLATEGEHRVFEEEQMRDIREVGLRYNGVAIRWDGVKVRVRWTDEVYRKLKCGFMKAALGKRERVEGRIAAIRHPSYPDIFRQKKRIIRAVMRRRKRGGKERIFDREGISSSS